MAQLHCCASQADRRPLAKLNLVSVAVLFVVAVSIVLVLVGVVTRGSTPLAVLPAVVAGFAAILRLWE